MFFLKNNEMELKEKKKRVKLVMSNGGHLIVKLKKVGKWNDKNSIYLVKKEVDVISRKAIEKSYRNRHPSCQIWDH